MAGAAGAVRSEDEESERSEGSSQPPPGAPADSEQARGSPYHHAGRATLEINRYVM